MDKKTALVTLLENSFWIADEDKLVIINKLDTLSDEQIDTLGKFLAEERNIMLRDQDKILARSQTLLDTIGNAVLQGQ